MIRAKFQCISEKKYRGGVWTGDKYSVGYLYEYEFSVVVGNKGEDAKFFASTPSGTVHLSSVNSGLFAPGKNYYLDFTEVDDENSSL